LQMPKKTPDELPVRPVEVGIKALRADISRWIDTARRHDVVITDRGRPVARLVPIREHPALDRLISRGLVRLPSRPASRLDPSDAVKARGTVSDLVAEHRR
jgi:prevent-host-death family protein